MAINQITKVSVGPRELQTRMSLRSEIYQHTDYYTAGHLKDFYAFNAGTLTQDYSGEGHTLSNIGIPTENSSGLFGGCVNLDSTSGFSVANHADFRPKGAFTVCCWVKYNGSAPNDAVARSMIQSWAGNLGAHTGAGFQFAIYSGWGVHVFEFAISSDDTTDAIAFGGNPFDNLWHFLVGTVDGTHVTLYIDGLLVNQVDYMKYCKYKSTNYVRIGCSNESGTNIGFLGGPTSGAYLDELYLFKGKAFTLAEVQALYTNTYKICGVNYFNISKVGGVSK